MPIETGVNLSSVQLELSKDYFGTLARIAEAGYSNIELVGYNISNYTRYMDVLPANELREKLAELGLSAVSGQEAARMDRPLDDHDWDSVCSYYETLNCRKIVLPSVWISNREDTMRIAEQMNRVGKRMYEKGFILYYHNHAHEFLKDGDRTLYEELIGCTDPAYVRFELDLGWVLRAGHQPADMLKKLGGRCDIVHFKDISPSPKFPVNIFETLHREGDKAFDSFMIYRDYTAPEDYSNLGRGTFDLVEICAFIRGMGHVRYAITENITASPDKFASLANDLRILKQYF
ncbi:sugar phosphate isomerase/epimerase [Paenibacillus sp.]|uniref:sugar phosphate isomerase/epimerase family protein n=1 Tax=Paenibacillus sp. TaxID=58172 RepID=UPI002D5EB25D|nr:sugar phosphate isomerase/epimerase [Paenibacillus sp.]HZG87987.1 sugar phosphate isomerase/epimerase [Paenibacillus sp.]